MKAFCTIIACLLSLNCFGGNQMFFKSPKPVAGGGGGVPLSGEYTNITSKNYAFAQLGGTKLKLVNLVPRPTDSGNGGNGVPANFYQLLYDWGHEGTNGAAWTQWIRPEIDAAAAQRANCIRFMFDATAWVGDASHHGAATFVGTNTYPMLSNMLWQVTDYAASKGMYFYATATEIRPVNASGITYAQLAGYLTNYVQFATARTNTICVDILQEFNGDGTGTLTWNSTTNVVTLAKSLRVRPVPVTCSINGVNSYTDQGGLSPVNNPAYAALAGAGVDFFDCHYYYQLNNIEDFDQPVTNQFGLPVVNSESGIPYNGTFAAGSWFSSPIPNSDQRSAAQYATFPAFQNRYDIQLGGVWSIVGQTNNAGNDYGIYGSEQDGSYVFTNLRPVRAQQVAAMVTNVQPLNTPFQVLIQSNNTASDFSSAGFYQAGNFMYAADASIWHWQDGAIQVTNQIQTDGNNLLYFSAVHSANGQTVSFDIPSGRNYYRGSGGLYIVWDVMLRARPAGAGFNENGYLIGLTSDSSGTYDNNIKVQTLIDGSYTQIGFVQYSPSQTLDLTKNWRLTATISSNVSPSYITVTLTNLTDGLAMSPSLVITDSTASLQSPGFAGLSYFQGSAFYSNATSSAQWDITPQSGIAPSATPGSGNVTLTWTAAQGGQGSVSYQPQLVMADANWFPVTNWSKAMTTNGLSQTIGGLAAAQKYLGRVMITDSVPYTNFSPWARFTTP